MKRFFKHLHKINKHKFMVFKLCCKCGLFFRGLTHDLSKYSPKEFFEGVKYYTDGKSSPNKRSREQKGYSAAWLHHKGRNKHHIEYWFDEEAKEQALIPFKYLAESVCDKIAATKCYKGKSYKQQDVVDYWHNNSSKLTMNPRVKEFFETVLTDLANQGEDYILRKSYLKDKYNQIVKGESKN